MMELPLHRSHGGYLLLPPFAVRRVDDCADDGDGPRCSLVLADGATYTIAGTAPDVWAAVQRAREAA